MICNRNGLDELLTALHTFTSTIYLLPVQPLYTLCVRIRRSSISSRFAYLGHTARVSSTCEERCWSSLITLVTSHWHVQLPPPPTTMSHQDSPYDIRKKYTRFRILVIGRANAGKTTLLQRVCNTTDSEDPSTSTTKNLLESTTAAVLHLLSMSTTMCLTLAISARDT